MIHMMIQKYERNEFMIKLVVVLAGIALIGVTGCKPKVDPSEPGSKLLDERCNRCHPMGVKKAGKSPEEWDQTVSKMMRKGAVLTNEEKAVLVDYLSRVYKP